LSIKKKLRERCRFPQSLSRNRFFCKKMWNLNFFVNLISIGNSPEPGCHQARCLDEGSQASESSTHPTVGIFCRPLSTGFVFRVLKHFFKIFLSFVFLKNSQWQCAYYVSHKQQHCTVLIPNNWPPGVDSNPRSPVPITETLTATYIHTYIGTPRCKVNIFSHTVHTW
jgi:hypothetical protein